MIATSRNRSSGGRSFDEVFLRVQAARPGERGRGRGAGSAGGGASTQHTGGEAAGDDYGTAVNGVDWADGVDEDEAVLVGIFDQSDEEEESESEDAPPIFDETGDESDYEGLTSEICADLCEDYYCYLARRREEKGFLNLYPVLDLSCCNFCYSPSLLKPGPGGHRAKASAQVLLVTSIGIQQVSVPLFVCSAASGNPACTRPQHVRLLEYGYLPSSFDEAYDLASQRGRASIYLHVELLEEIVQEQHLSPGFSLKAWCGAYVKRVRGEAVSAENLERVLGRSCTHYRLIMRCVRRMTNCGIPDYPGEKPLFGTCPACAEACEPVANGFPDAKIDLQLDGCMSFVHFEAAAPNEGGGHAPAVPWGELVGRSGSASSHMS